MGGEAARVSSGARIEQSFIIAGLDPAIHLLGHAKRARG